MTISENTITEVLRRVDIVDVVGQHVQLKKAGANFTGLCPFHGEKSPSFSVSPTKQFYHCFGCGKSGDAIKFLMEHLGTSFPETVQDLAQKHGIVIDDNETPEDKRKRQERAVLVEKITSANDRAQLYFAQWLGEAASSPVMEYVKKRRLLPESVQKFGLGYAPSGNRLVAAARAKGEAAVKLLVDSALIVEVEDEAEGHVRLHDRFRDRLMFPIHDGRGALVGFGGRALRDDQKPKYLNSPETASFDKGKILYGLHHAAKEIQRSKAAWVVEGYMDVISMHQHGITNTVAALGTAFSEDHAKQLSRLAQQIIFLFDADGAGDRAAYRAMLTMLPLSKDGLVCRFMRLGRDQGKDADEFLSKSGSPQAMLELAACAPTLGQYLFSCLDKNIPIDTPEGRAHYESEAKDLIGKLPTSNTAFRRQLYETLDKRLGRNQQRTYSGRSDASSFGGRQDPHGLLAGRARVQAILNPGQRKAWSSKAAPMPPPPQLGTSKLPSDEQALLGRLRDAVRLAPNMAVGMSPHIRSLIDKFEDHDAALQVHRELDHLENEGFSNSDDAQAIDFLGRWQVIAEAHLKSIAANRLADRLKRGEITSAEYVSASELI